MIAELMPALAGGLVGLVTFVAAVILHELDVPDMLRDRYDSWRRRNAPGQERLRAMNAAALAAQQPTAPIGPARDARGRFMRRETAS